MALKTPVVSGLEPVPGTVRLIFARWLLSLLAALPGIQIGRGALAETMGRRPFFSDAPDPLPMVPLLELARNIPSAVWAGLASGLALAWLGNLCLTAGAVEVLDPLRAPVKVRVWRSIFDTGCRFLWIYLRVSLVALLAILLGSRVIKEIFDRLADHGQLARWTGKTLWLTLPIAKVVLMLVWFGIVGVFAWWCRVIVVSDRRRYVRRLTLNVPRLWRRHPFQGLLFHWILAVASISVGARVLFAWRQSGAGTAAWLALWLAVLLLQAFVWQWRLRVCRLLWATPRLEDLRLGPDEPWQLARRLARRLRRRTDHPGGP